MAKSTKIKGNALSSTIATHLQIYSGTVTDGIKKQTKQSMSKMVKLTKAQTFKRDTEEYRSSISSRLLRETARGVTYQWYVKAPHYRLSHLLEDGHVMKDGGRFKGYGFISAATETVREEYLRKIEEVIRNGY